LSLLETSQESGIREPIPIPIERSEAVSPHSGVNSRPNVRNKLVPILVWCCLSLIWGTTWLFIKLGLRDLPPFSFAGIRFVVAALILLVLVGIRRRHYLPVGATGC
jgi:EamA-like transporter family